MEYNIFETPRGRFLLTTSGDLVSDQIKAGQFWEHELIPVFDRVTPHDVVVEVGAYVGEHSIDLAKRCKWLYTFEGKRSTYYQLCANLLLNYIDNATAYNMCVGTGDSFVIGSSPDPGNAAAYLYKPDRTGTTLAHSLDSVLFDELTRLDFLKVDVEGMDLDVLVGAESLIYKYKPLIVFEFNSVLTVPLKQYTDFLKEYKVEQLGIWNWLATPL
jgi:FkbM family methyltransferase